MNQEVPQKGEVIAEGKTKTIYEVVGNPNVVIVQNRNDITAHDDPKFTRSFATKAVSATITTCRMFELLRRHGVPVSFERQLSDTEFLARRSQMVPLEVVFRRFAVGSYLKRHPESQSQDLTKPVRFDKLCFELFLKTKNKHWQGHDFPDDDPLIIDPYGEDWELYRPKHKNTPIGLRINKDDQDRVLCGLTVQEIEEIGISAFLVLEQAWAKLGCDLIDVKFELDNEGRISDVIDNDSWRLWKDGKPWDKQVFRDGGEGVLEEVENNYAHIAREAVRLSLLE